MGQTSLQKTVVLAAPPDTLSLLTQAIAEAKNGHMLTIIQAETPERLKIIFGMDEPHDVLLVDEDFVKSDQENYTASVRVGQDSQTYLAVIASSSDREQPSNGNVRADPERLLANLDDFVSKQLRGHVVLRMRGNIATNMRLLLADIERCSERNQPYRHHPAHIPFETFIEK